MATGRLSGSISIASLSFDVAVNREGETQIGHDPTCPKGYAGTLTTRTSDTAGIVTAAGVSGMSEGDDVDIYSGTDGVSHGGNIDTINGNLYTISGLGGDVLPAQDSAVIMSKRSKVVTTFDGDNAKMIAAMCAKRAHIELQEAAEVTQHAQKLTAGEAWFWMYGYGTNPITGNPVVAIECTTADTEAAQVVQIGVIDDSVT